MKNILIILALFVGLIQSQDNSKTLVFPVWDEGDATINYLLNFGHTRKCLNRTKVIHHVNECIFNWTVRQEGINETYQSSFQTISDLDINTPIKVDKNNEFINFKRERVKVLIQPEQAPIDLGKGCQIYNLEEFRLVKFASNKEGTDKKVRMCGASFVTKRKNPAALRGCKMPNDYHYLCIKEEDYKENKPLDEITELEDYVVHCHGRHCHTIAGKHWNNPYTKKLKNINLKENNLYLGKSSETLSETTLTLSSVDSPNKIFLTTEDKNLEENLSLIKVSNNKNSYTNTYLHDLSQEPELKITPKEGSGYRIKVNSVDANSVTFTLNEYPEEILIADRDKERSELYLSQLLDRCIDIYQFVEAAQISACVQREAYNDKQLAMQQEEINLLKAQNQLLANQPVASSNDSAWLGVFIGALTGSIINNSIQSNKYQNKINNLQRQINQNRNMNNQQNWRTTN
jgi:hypothetical protein